jgi:mannose-6-phosphate isomerase-like protein (cupin superfamily)
MAADATPDRSPTAPLDWHADYAAALAKLPGAATETYPEGAPFTTALAHGTLTVELFAPKVEDRQQPHAQDELYVVHTGTSGFVRDGARVQVGAGDVVFVPAGMPHRFEDFSDDFVTWVVFWGPVGGESGP